jgi:glutamate 5-kinase
MNMDKIVFCVSMCSRFYLCRQFFSLLDQPIAQVLLTRENLALEHHYRNAKNTFTRLLELGVVPIVNENDTVRVQELRFGDNDTLSALVASLIDADWLFLLTDVDALYTADPRTAPDARPLRVVQRIDDLACELGTVGSPWGTGGMATKVSAVRAHGQRVGSGAS